MNERNMSVPEALAKIRGRAAEIYIARRGTATIIRCEGTDYLINNVGGGACVINPVEDYWRHSISWKGTRVDYMVNGVVPPKSPADWSIAGTFDKDLDMMGLY